MKNRKVGMISVFFAVIVLLSSAFIAVGCAGNGKDEQTDIQYVIYLGTNDKDTVEPVFAPEAAKEKAIEILLKYFGGYTIQDANGGWTDNGKVFTEYTLVIYISDTTLDKIHAACDELIEVFRQSTILIQANKTTTEFYYGGDK